MTDENTTYFVMNESVYISDVINNKILIYDTASGNRLSINTQEEIDNCLNIYSSENNGVVNVSETTDRQNHIFYQKLVDKGFAYYSTIDRAKDKPFIFLPLLSLNDDLDKKGDNYDEILNLIRLDSGKYLKSINLHLQNKCSIGCENCLAFHLQINKCVSQSISSRLSFNQVKMIIDNLQCTNVQKINLLGGDLSLYPKLDNVVEYLLLNTNYEITITLQLTTENIQLFRELRMLSNKITFKFLVLPKLLNKKVKKNILSLLKYDETSFAFYISSENEYVEFKSLKLDMYSDKIKLYPVENSNTRCHFLINNISYSKDDIFFEPISIHKILRNQKLNANFFGHFSIYADGTVRANPNTSVIGNIFKDDIRDVIYYELVASKTWRLVRKKHKCSSCLFQDLCPPISNYELVFDRLFCSKI